MACPQESPQPAIAPIITPGSHAIELTSEIPCGLLQLPAGLPRWSWHDSHLSQRLQDLEWLDLWTHGLILLQLICQGGPSTACPQDSLWLTPATAKAPGPIVACPWTPLSLSPSNWPVKAPQSTCPRDSLQPNPTPTAAPANLPRQPQ